MDQRITVSPVLASAIVDIGRLDLRAMGGNPYDDLRPDVTSVSIVISDLPNSQTVGQASFNPNNRTVTIEINSDFVGSDASLNRGALLANLLHEGYHNATRSELGADRIASHVAIAGLTEKQDAAVRQTIEEVFIRAAVQKTIQLNRRALAGAPTQLGGNQQHRADVVTRYLDIHGRGLFTDSTKTAIANKIKPLTIDALLRTASG